MPTEPSPDQLKEVLERSFTKMNEYISGGMENTDLRATQILRRPDGVLLHFDQTPFAKIIMVGLGIKWLPQRFPQLDPIETEEKLHLEEGKVTDRADYVVTGDQVPTALCGAQILVRCKPDQLDTLERLLRALFGAGG